MTRPAHSSAGSAASAANDATALAPDDVAARLNAIESELGVARRQARRWRRGVGLMAAALATFVLTGAREAADQETLTVRSLQILDADGRLVMKLGSDAAGGRLDLWTSGAMNALRLGVNRHGGDVNVWTGAGDAAAGIWATGGGGRVGTWDSSGTRRTVIASDGDGVRIELEDGRGADRADTTPPDRAVTTARGFTVTSAGGRAALEAGDGFGSLQLGDANRPTHGLQARGGADEAAIQLLTGAGDAQLGLDRDGPSLDLSGPGDAAAVRLATGARGRPDGLARLDVLTAGRVVGRFAARPQGGGDVRLFDARGRQGAAIAAGEGGGLVNLFNPREVGVVRLGADPDGRGGVFELLNLRGLPVVAARTDADGDGEFSVADADARRPRVMRPTGTTAPVRATRAESARP